MVSITRDAFEYAELDLQFEKGCFIIHTTSAVESIRAMKKITNTIVEGVLKKDDFDTFCAETVVTKSYSTPQDILVAQLEQIRGISHSIARTIVQDFPTLRSLISMFNNRALTKGIVWLCCLW